MFNKFEPNRIRSLVGWDVLEDTGGPVVQTVRFARAHELLPESYLYGFAHTFRFSRYRKAFLNGEYRSTGWVGFFPYTTLVKTPLALFGLMGLSALYAASRRRETRPMTSTAIDQRRTEEFEFDWRLAQVAAKSGLYPDIRQNAEAASKTQVDQTGMRRGVFTRCFMSEPFSLSSTTDKD